MLKSLFCCFRPSATSPLRSTSSAVAHAMLRGSQAGACVVEAGSRAPASSHQASSATAAAAAKPLDRLTQAAAEDAYARHWPELRAPRLSSSQLYPDGGLRVERLRMLSPTPFRRATMFKIKWTHIAILNQFPRQSEDEELEQHEADLLQQLQEDSFGWCPAGGDLVSAAPEAQDASPSRSGRALRAIKSLHGGWQWRREQAAELNASLASRPSF